MVIMLMVSVRPWIHISRKPLLPTLLPPCRVGNASCHSLAACEIMPLNGEFVENALLPAMLPPRGAQVVWMTATPACTEMPAPPPQCCPMLLA